jgi:hypothetical protein
MVPNEHCARFVGYSSVAYSSVTPKPLPKNKRGGSKGPACGLGWFSGQGSGRPVRVPSGASSAQTEREGAPHSAKPSAGVTGGCGQQEDGVGVFEMRDALAAF